MGETLHVQRIDGVPSRIRANNMIIEALKSRNEHNPFVGDLVICEDCVNYNLT